MKDSTTPEIKLNTNTIEIEGPSLEIGPSDKRTFEEAGRKVKTIQLHTRLWLGDWCNEMRDRYGQKTLREAIDAAGLERSCVYLCGRVAAAYSSELRGILIKDFGAGWEWFLAGHKNPDKVASALARRITVKEFKQELEG